MKACVCTWLKVLFSGDINELCTCFSSRYINEAVDRIAKTPLPNLLKHFDRNQGKDNEERLIGDHFIPSHKEFSMGVADKFTCVRIPLRVAEAGCGYLEERRPAADCDPYAATLAFMKAIYTDELL